MWWEFTVDWPMGQRGRYAGKPIPALTLNHHISPRVAQSRSKRLRSTVAREAAAARGILAAAPCQQRRQLRVVLLRGKRQHMLDRDAVFAALKPAVDGIVDAGWLVDDREKWCDYDAKQERALDGIPRIRFTVREMRR